MGRTDKLVKHLKAFHRKRIMVGIAGVLLIGVIAALILGTRPPVFPMTPGADAIVFRSRRNLSFDLYAIYPDGAHETRLTYLRRPTDEWWFPDLLIPYEDLLTNSHPRPVPGGQGVTFTSNFEGAYWLYQMDVDGSDFHRVDSPLSANTIPIYSPDAQQIAYLPRSDELIVSNADGSGKRCLTCGMGGSLLLPVWAPDGHALVFSFFNDKEENLYRVNVDGTNLIRLTNSNAPNAFNADPAWSPNGQQIAFSSNQAGGSPEIYVMNADGSNQVQLTSISGKEPSWSPDGQQIAFTANPEEKGAEIYVMNADGSNLRGLTVNSPGNSSPVWVRMR